MSSLCILRGLLGAFWTSEALRAFVWPSETVRDISGAFRGILKLSGPLVSINPIILFAGLLWPVEVFRGH